MAEYNNNIEQMYMFIIRNMKSNGCEDVSDNSEWLRQIDTKYGNGDGTLVKSEFSYFVKKELSAEDFEQFGNKTGNAEADKNDIINKFWAKIDTNRELKHINGTRLYDQNALNKDEVENVNIGIKRHELLQEYMATFPNPSCPPFDRSEDLVKQYRTKITESLMNSMVKDNVHPNKLIEYFDSKLPDLTRKTAADIMAQYYLDLYSTTIKNLGYDEKEIRGLLFSSDSHIQNMINSYISGFKLPHNSENYNKDGLEQLEGVTGSLHDDENAINGMLDVVGNNVQHLIQQYLGMAFPDKADESTDPFKNPKVKEPETRIKFNDTEKVQMYLDGTSILVTRCGYDPEIDEPINELQQFAIKKKLDEDIAYEMSLVTEEQAPYYAECKDLYLPVMNKFVTELIGSGSITVGNYDSYYSKEVALAEQLFERADYKQLVNTINETAKKVEKEVNKIFNHSTTKIKYSNIVDNVNTNFKPSTTTATPAFYVTNDGKVKFVNYNNVHGVFNDSPNTTLNGDMDKLKSELEAAFKEVLDSAGFDDNLKSNLFQSALFLTMSDTSIVESQYKTQNMKNIFNAVVKNYAVILQNAVEDSDVKENLKNYNSNSILAGRNPATSNYEDKLHNNDAFYKGNAKANEDVNKYLTRPGKTFDPNNPDTYYYKDDTTGKDNMSSTEVSRDNGTGNGVARGDDWVYVDGYSMNNKNGYNIYYLSNTQTKHPDSKLNDLNNDDAAVNAGITKLFSDYLSIYGNQFSRAELEEIFSKAEKTAFDNLASLTDQINPNGTSVYGYGERLGAVNLDYDPKDNYDTAKNGDGVSMLVNAGSVILNIMYEFEALIVKKQLLFENTKLQELLAEGGTVNGVTSPKFGEAIAQYIVDAAASGNNEALENIRHEITGKLILETLTAPLMQELYGSEATENDTVSIVVDKYFTDKDKDCFFIKNEDGSYGGLDTVKTTKCFGYTVTIETEEDLFNAIEEYGISSEFAGSSTYYSGSRGYLYKTEDERYKLDHEKIIADFGVDVHTPGQLLDLLSNKEITINGIKTKRTEVQTLIANANNESNAPSTQNTPSITGVINEEEIRNRAKQMFLDLVQRDLVDIFKDGLPAGMSMDELNTVYDTMVKSARATGNLDEIKQAAILYLDYVSSIDDAETADIKDAIKAVIKNKFGDDYNAKINQETYKSETVNTDMESLINTMNNIEYFSKTATATWSNLQTNMELSISAYNAEQSFSRGFSATIKDKQGKIVDSSRITYSIEDIVGTSASIRYDASLKQLIVTPSDTPGETTANLYAFVDGVKVKLSKKPISVNNKLNISSVNDVQFTAKHDPNWGNPQNKTATIANWSGSRDYIDVSVSCCKGTGRLDLAKPDALTGIEDILINLGNSFKNAGYDSVKISDAITTTINYYKAVISATSDIRSSDWTYGYGNISISYRDSKNQVRSESTKFFQYTRVSDDGAFDTLHRYMQGSQIEGSGICIWEGYTGRNSYGFCIAPDLMLKKFEQFYNELT